MSALELLLLAGAAALALARWAPAGLRRPLTGAAAALTVLSGTALALRGPRWQLLPVLAGAVAGLALTVRRPGPLAGRAVRRWPAVTATAACLGLLAAGAGAAWAFPEPAFPEPSGPYPVGTTVAEWTDPARPEPATRAPSDRCTVVAQLWYPAREPPGDAERAQYLGRTRGEARTVAAGLTGHLGLPAFLLDAAARARTAAIPGAAVAEGDERFPVVVFSPGLGGVRTQSTVWAEELASRGYVVAALDHPYDSAAVVLDDGRTIPTRLRADDDPSDDDRQAAGWTAVRAADLSFALTQLGRLDRGALPGPLQGRIDAGHAAATGHSLGGAAALQAVRQDSRFDAVVDIDGFPRDPAPRPFRQPALALTAGIDAGGRREAERYATRLARVLDLSTSPSYRLIVPGAAHLTFTDAPLYLPPVPAFVGTLGRSAGPATTAAATAAFLDATLRGRPGDLASNLARHGDLATFA